MSGILKDVVITEEHPNTLLKEKHIDYIVAYSKKKDDFESTMTDHFRMSGVFWGLSAIDILGHLDKMDKSQILEFVRSCRCSNGGYAPCVDHDPHLLYTLSAVQVLVLLEADEKELDVESLVSYVKSLQNNDGSFCGDQWGEVDTRFSFCAVAALKLINRLDAINVTKAVDFVLSCQNTDGGFGTRPGSESHAGQIYCCVGLLSITGNLHRVNADLLGWWLSERQLPSGGLNGRPEKLPDVCYSWWVLASLAVLGRIHWIDRDKMVRFIHATQDPETGGFTDRPGDVADLFHTLFGLAGLSLLHEESLGAVNPVFCMAESRLIHRGISVQVLTM